MSEDNASDSCFESESDFSSRPLSREQLRDDHTATNSKCASPCFNNRGIISTLDKSEQEIKERLMHLEQINADFVRDLLNREKLYAEKERQYGEFVQTEQRFIGDLKRLSDERDTLKLQVEKLEEEKKDLSERVEKLEAEMRDATARHNEEIKDIKTEQEVTISQLQQRVDHLLLKERDHLKQITNLKLERCKNSDKTESDKLKSSYVELQLELSRTRDDMRRKEEEFRLKLEETRSKHMLEEARLISEIEMLQKKDQNCNDLIQSFQQRQEELMIIVKQKEQALDLARTEYIINVEATEEEHLAIEAELKKRLIQMEEGTAIATKALTEERVRLEKELKENIDDLRGKEEGYKAKIAELETNVSHLHEELQRITGNIDSGFGPGLCNNGMSSFRREKLMNQLRELQSREQELKEKLDEMEQKELAYKVTLEQADRIVERLEKGYKLKIEDLETSERILKQRVGHLEEIEDRLRGALYRERRSSDGRSADDLVAELLQAEARENSLKEVIERLEHANIKATQKIKELEKLLMTMEAELNDKEALAADLQKSQSDLDSSRKALAKLRKSESELKSSLQQTETILATTETEMRNRLKTMEEEKSSLEETIRELRAQVRELKSKLEKVTEESEARMLSMNVSKRHVSHVYASQQPNDDDEPDYVDVDDFPVQSPKGYAKNRPASYVYNRSALTKSSAGSQESRDSRKIVNAQQKDTESQQTQPDTYDSACQNLEDCMKRAMEAMKNDMKRKQLDRKISEKHLKTLLSSNTNTTIQVPEESAPNDDNDYDEVLPRPTNFRVIRQVGTHSVLVGWDYINPSILKGFEVRLNGQLLDTAFTPDRNRALIGGLNLKLPITISISALSNDGQMSEPTLIELNLSKPNPTKYQLPDDDDADDTDDEYEKHRPYSMEW